MVAAFRLYDATGYNCRVLAVAEHDVAVRYSGDGEHEADTSPETVEANGDACSRHSVSAEFGV